MSEQNRVDAETDRPQPVAQPDEEYYRRRGRGRQLGLLLLLLGLGWLVFEFSFRGTTFGMSWGFSQNSVQRDATFDARSLSVIGVSDEVRLEVWDREQIQVQATIHGYGWNGSAARSAAEQVDLVMEQRGERVYLEHRQPWRVCIFFCRTPYIEYRINVPQSALVDVELVSGDALLQGAIGESRVKTVSGNIEVQGARGPLRVETVSGEVILGQLAGELQVDTTSGDLELQDAELSSARIGTTSGDFDLRRLSGDLNLRTVSGNIEISDHGRGGLIIDTNSGDINYAGELRGAEEYTIETISGEVTLDLPAETALDLELRSVSGDFELDMPLENERQVQGGLDGRLGEGGSLLRVATTSGDVRLR